MVNGFSKMNLLGSTKQRSMELLDLLSFPQNPEPPTDINTTTTSSSSGNPNATILEHSHTPSSQLGIEDDSDSEGEQQSRVLLLHKSHSVSSEAAPQRLWFYKGQGGAKIQAAAAVKKAFSVRRSSSYSSSSSSVVSERHCSRTINGRCLTMSSSHFGDDINTGDAAQPMVSNNNNNIALQTTSLQKKNKMKIGKLQQRTDKIFKACKGIFGL